MSTDTHTAGTMTTQITIVVVRETPLANSRLTFQVLVGSASGAAGMILQRFQWSRLDLRRGDFGS